MKRNLSSGQKSSVMGDQRNKCACGCRRMLVAGHVVFQDGKAYAEGHSPVAQLVRKFARQSQREAL